MTYRPDFTGVWAKIERGKTHRDVLESEIGEAFAVESDRIGVSVEYDLESGYHLLRVETSPDQLLLRWGVIIGDVLHNLRGALDHLVWQLSLFKRKGREPSDPERVQFPLKETPDASPSPEHFQRTGNLHAVRGDHRAIIERYQPYKGWNGVGIHPFLRLKELSNRDKHRTVTPILMATDPFKATQRIFEEWGGTVMGVASDVGVPAKTDANILAVRVSPPALQKNVKMAGYISPSVMLSDAQAGLVAVVEALDNIAVLVIQVVREFEPLF